MARSVRPAEPRTPPWRGSFVPESRCQNELRRGPIARVASRRTGPVRRPATPVGARPPAARRMRRVPSGDDPAGSWPGEQHSSTVKPRRIRKGCSARRRSSRPRSARRPGPPPRSATSAGSSGPRASSAPTRSSLPSRRPTSTRWAAWWSPASTRWASPAHPDLRGASPLRSPRRQRLWRVPGTEGPGRRRAPRPISRPTPGLSGPPRLPARPCLAHGVPLRRWPCSAGKRPHPDEQVGSFSRAPTGRRPVARWWPGRLWDPG